MKLINKTQNILISDELEVANTFLKRFFGLMGKKTFPQDKALWIQSCNSIHTFFMFFSIDVVFINKQMEVTKVAEDISCCRFKGSLKADSVIEFRSQKISKKVNVGDILHVGT